MVQITAEKRDISIKPYAIRAAGNIPAVFYSGKEQATSIVIPLSVFSKVYKEAGESSVVTLDVAGRQVNVLIHDVAFHPVTSAPIHVDFYAIEADKPVEVDVSLEFTGTAPAEKLGGILVKVMHEITVKGLPKDLPHEVTVDVGVLRTFEDHITIADLVLPSGIVAVADADEVVALIGSAAAEEEAPAATFDAAAVAVEKKGKKEEDAEA